MTISKDLLRLKKEISIDGYKCILTDNLKGGVLDIFHNGNCVCIIRDCVGLRVKYKNVATIVFIHDLVNKLKDEIEVPKGVKVRATYYGRDYIGIRSGDTFYTPDHKRDGFIYPCQKIKNWERVE